MTVVYTIPEVDSLGSLAAATIEGFNADRFVTMLQGLLDVAWFTINDNINTSDIVSNLTSLIHDRWFLIIDVNTLYSLSPLLTDTMLWLAEVIIKHGLVMSNMIVRYTPGFITIQ